MGNVYRVFATNASVPYNSDFATYPIAQVNSYWNTNPPSPTVGGTPFTKYVINNSLMFDGSIDFNIATGLISDFATDTNIYLELKPATYINQTTNRELVLDLGYDSLDPGEAGTGISQGNTIVSFGIINKPAISFNSVTDIRYIIGEATNLPILVTDLPNDGSLYKIWFQTTSSQILWNSPGGGSVASDSGIWEYNTDGTYNGYWFENFSTASALFADIVGMRLNTRPDSNLQNDSSPPRIRYLIVPNWAGPGTIPYPWAATPWIDIKNGAKVNLAATSFSIPRNSTTSVNVGNYTWSGVKFLDESTTYTLKIETKSALASIPAWSNEGGNVYSISGTPNELEDILAAVSFTVGAVGPFIDMSIKLYRASDYISNQTVRFNFT
jgi:hypothetical protein